MTELDKILTEKYDRKCEQAYRQSMIGQSRGYTNQTYYMGENESGLDLWEVKQICPHFPPTDEGTKSRNAFIKNMVDNAKLELMRFQEKESNE